MLLQRNRPTQREFRGPEPGSVGILCRKPYTKPPDWRILESKAEEDARNNVLEQLAIQKKQDLISEWEASTNKKILMNNVKRRVMLNQRGREIDLETRKDRLRALLLNEERSYIEEMANSQETVLERQAKLREKARLLKEDKEAYRQAIADEKYRQLWRNQCEELRAALSKRQTLEIAFDNQVQIKQKEELLRAKKNDDDAFFMRLWEEELQKKIDREENDAQVREAKNREQTEYLKLQINALKKKREEEKLLKLEEAKLLDEMAALRKIEEQKEAEERVRRQKETRDLLQSNIRMKMRRKAKEVQEQLAFDTMILEQLLEESKKEAEQELKKKEELRRQDMYYREYMRQLKQQEIEREKEMDRLADIEVEKQWRKRVERWEQEKKARGAMLDQILEERKLQVQEKILENEQRRQAAKAECEEIQRQIEANKLLDAQEKAEVHAKFRNHQNDLLQQIEHNRYLRQLEKEEDERENEKMRQAEREYQERMAKVMDPDWIDPKAHPLRKAWIESMYHNNANLTVNGNSLESNSVCKPKQVHFQP